MTPRTGIRRRYGSDGEHGQMIVLFALCLVAIIAVAGLLIDGGLTWSNRRQAQAAADTAALAAAKGIVANTDGRSAALSVARANKFGNDTTDCSGVTLPGNAGPGVQVNHPPLNGPHTVANDPLHADEYVEVFTQRKMKTTFSGVLGMSCWMVSARAVSSIGVTSVAQCSFCALNKSEKNHSLLIQSGAALRVDGDIYVNSSNGLPGKNNTDGKDFQADGSCVPVGKDGKDHVCGDGFDLFGDAPNISAQTISVVGGWEQQGKNATSLTQADELAKVNGAPCPLHTEPVVQVPLANVCINMPQIQDPFDDTTKPKNLIVAPAVPAVPAANVNGCPAGARIPSGTSGAPATLAINAGLATICPGAYYGGINISGSASVTMVAGIYYIAGGGFKVAGTSTIDGGAGVMIYNSSGGTTPHQDTDPGDDLIPNDIPAKPNPTNLTFDYTPGGDPDVNDVILLKFTFKTPATPVPTGTVKFYDGPAVIAGCSAVGISLAAPNWTATATCSTSWSSFGKKKLTAVYSGDTTYDSVGKTKEVKVKEPPASPIKQLEITTTGDVTLHGPASGPYAGLTIFQDRASTLTVELSPGGSPLANCTPDPGFMTVGVPNGVAPGPCGDIGGLQGTIYAPGAAGDEGALVLITASGLANLQVIASKIQVTNDANARFAFTPQFFANGEIKLVE